ncbi:nitroreductase family protein [Thauera sp. 2A1]|uniref:nitroreductase family protein n=1 Tax=Thauera sp. 2A1 TaxID=2570191 RepID=UPI0012928DF7|nr:nitroreductase family protein [Thauera sp. 2A1]KAI5912525.1 nitroreductase family protein [Thauera sp. 2A1]
MPSSDTINKILELARWAPSGDNTQPWRFEIVSDDELVIHGFDTHDHCVYDLDGMPSRLAHGALLETLAIAASGFGLKVTITFEPVSDTTRPRYRVALARDVGIGKDPLFDHIIVRVTQRRSMRMGGLDAARREVLSAILTGAGGQVIWFDRLPLRLAIAKLLFRSAWIRLVTREAYEVHRAVIDWGKQFSETALPDQALGADALTVRMMRWAMADWRRVEFMNRYFGGTLAPRIQLDLLPGLQCAAHFALVAPGQLADGRAQVEVGRLLQRFWLEVTRQDMYLQPEMTPLIFSRYVQSGVQFTKHVGAQARARDVRERMGGLLGEATLERTFFFGRVGFGSAPSSRSLRLPPEKLIVRP